MQLKKITLEEATAIAVNPEAKVYMLVRLHDDTTLNDLSYAEGFYKFDEEAAPEPEVKAPSGKTIDHGRICALYTANPPRSVQWIADDMKISAQTVINHLKKEGIYKK